MNIELIQNVITDNSLVTIAKKIEQKERISFNEGIYLFQNADLAFLGMLANYIRVQKNGNYVYFNNNFHIEPTNICIYNCKFCSYSRKFNQEGSWEYTVPEILDIVKNFKNKSVTEVHIVGGVHPHRDLHYYGTLIQKIKTIIPNIHVKAFTAVELDYMIRKAKIPLEKGLKIMKDYGLDSMPGGGAEIFHQEIRSKICHEKSKADDWLKIHETAHNVGIPSNATILYGHIESYEHRIDHLEKLRLLQDKTHGFNAFIPLKYRNTNNEMSYVGEVSLIEDLRNYAISRIYLDNFDHIKAYWPMIGKQATQLSLMYGVDDIDGTIDDTTKIYSMAGADDNKPTMTTSEIVSLIKEAHLIPVERDTLYNTIQEF